MNTSSKKVSWNLKALFPGPTVNLCDNQVQIYHIDKLWNYKQDKQSLKAVEQVEDLIQ